MDHVSEQILLQVRRGLALNRVSRWNFAESFLDVSFDEVRETSGTTSMRLGPHCVDADGNTSLGALLPLIDIALAHALRVEVGAAMRMATVSLTVHFTGAPCGDRVVVDGTVDGLLDKTVTPQSIIRQIVRSDDRTIATAIGSFIHLGNSRGLPPIPRRRHEESALVPPLDPAGFAEEEQEIYNRAEEALEGSSRGFLERFFEMRPVREPGGASCIVRNGKQITNRVGHLQGGIAMAIAAATASCALDPDWALSMISAVFLEGGVGDVITGHAEILRLGNLTVVVRTRLVGPNGKVILDATTCHARRA